MNELITNLVTLVLGALIGAILYRLVKSAWRRRQLRPGQQTCWAYCFRCKHELIGDGKSFISDGDAGVLFVCHKCGSMSLWNFDAPAPLLLRTWEAESHKEEKV